MQQKPINAMTAFFPAYNEEENIGKCIEQTKKALEKYAEQWEMLVVVFEGSIDRTKDIVKAWEKKDKRIKLIVQPKEKKGVGAAYKIGFDRAKYDKVFYCDSDNQFNPEEIKRFLPYIDEFDIIAGYRINRQDAKARIWTSKIYNWLMRRLFPIKEKDVDCAFRLVNKKIFPAVSLISTTGLMTGEMLAKARIAGYKITQVGITHYPRTAGEARFEMPAGLNVPKPRVVWETVLEIIKLRKDIKDWKKKYQERTKEQEEKKGIKERWKEVKNTAAIFWNAVLWRQCPLCHGPIQEKDYPEDLTQYGICTNKECRWGKGQK